MEHAQFECPECGRINLLPKRVGGLCFNCLAVIRAKPVVRRQTNRTPSGGFFPRDLRYTRPLRIDDIPDVLVYVVGGTTFHKYGCAQLRFMIKEEFWEKHHKSSVLAVVAGYYPCRRCNPLGKEWKRHKRDYHGDLLPSHFVPEPVRRANLFIEDLKNTLDSLDL